jgi:hypothetical protein
MRFTAQRHPGVKAIPVALLGLLAGCGGNAMTAGSGGAGSGGSGGPGGGGGSVVTGPLTYYKDVLPIVNKNCASCHSTGGIGPFPLTTYADAQPRAGLMAAATQSGLMPPWMPAAGCGDFRDVRRLSTTDVLTIQSWYGMGAPAGDPADAPPAAGPAGTDLGTPAVTLDPGVEYHPNAAVTDDYHCFLLDPGLAAAHDLVGFNVHPGTPGSVHHVLLFSVAPANLAAVQAKDAAEAGAGWTCFGGTGVDATPTVGGWVPGSGASAFPPPTGIHLAAGTQIIMQIHYNLLVKKDVADRTTADLFYSAAPVTKPAAISAVLNTKFLVPAGTKSQTVVADLPIKANYALWGVVPHMHVHGTEIKVQIRHADGSSACAVDVPKWDFHWQQFYYYQQPVPVVSGDTVHLECTYDNSAENQPVINGTKQAPAPLTWGEKTTDEMCLNYLYFTLP